MVNCQPCRMLVLTAGVLLLMFATISCNYKLNPKNPFPPQGARAGMDTGRYRSLSWNILLKKGDNAMAEIARVENDVKTRFPLINFQFDVFYCPCDSLLYNLAATAFDGSGNAIVPPPSPGGPPAPSGDILYISNNNRIVDNDTLRNAVSEKPTAIKGVIGVDPKNGDNILGILDTGLDTTRFSPSIGKLIWKPAPGKPQYNFVTGVVNDYFDNNHGKHGTGVTALALHQMVGMDTILPRIMVLKVLDGDKSGTTFTVSCGLSYAIKNGARILNASLGYYETNGVVDSVFRHYIEMATTLKSRPITVFAAAGNTSVIDPSSVCNDAPASNELVTRRLFYPACFSQEFSNLITVAGVNKATGVCSYQNFSSTFVNYGVKNVANCCFFKVPVLQNAVTGSSFATPVVAGMAMRARNITIGNFLLAHSTITPPLNNKIQGGKIILFDDTLPW